MLSNELIDCFDVSLYANYDDGRGLVLVDRYGIGSKEAALALVSDWEEAHGPETLVKITPAATIKNKWWLTKGDAL